MCIWCLLFSLSLSSFSFLPPSLPQLSPRFPYAHTLLGHEHVMLKDFEKAMSAFQTAVSLDPRHYNAWYVLIRRWITVFLFHIKDSPFFSFTSNNLCVTARHWCVGSLTRGWVAHFLVSCDIVQVESNMELHIGRGRNIYIFPWSQDMLLYVCAIYTSSIRRILYSKPQFCSS